MEGTVTALAAFWGRSTNAQPPLGAVERSLRGQQIYGVEPSLARDLGELALGRRLFPTLPEDAFDKGPIVGGGGRWHLVADVRLDARDDLCGELGIVPSEAKGLCDAAIVMRAIERWQDDAIPKLIGDFAVICWDAHEKRLILARDFLGNRPLHFHSCGTFLAVASMPKGLHALSAVPREPDETAVAEFVGMLPEHGSATFFRHIERVLPGEIVEFRDGGVRRRQYWNPTYRPLRLSDEDYVEATRGVFDQAVKARLRGAGSSIAAQLSGGLDSGAVMATAARLAEPNCRVVAFTAAPPEGFERPEYPGRFNDESALAAEIAAMYPNVEHVVVRGAAASPIAALDRNFYLFDRPILNLCNGVWVDQILDRAKARGLKVMLNGDMGNMTTSYDGFEFLAQALARGRLTHVAREIALLRRNGMRIRTSSARIVGSFLPRFVWETLYRLRGRRFRITDYTALTESRARELEIRAKARGLTNSRQPWRDNFGVRLSFLRRADLGNYSKGTLAGWGIDLRDPTSDQRVVELCLSIPPEQFLKAGRTRSLARRAFADRLPSAVVNDTRSGYQGADWYVGLKHDWDNVRREAEWLSRLPAAGRTMDVDRLRSLVNRGADEGIDWNSRETEGAYRLALLRGISAGHFLRRASGTN